MLHRQLANTKDSLSDAEHKVQEMEARLAQQVASQATVTRYNILHTMVYVMCLSITCCYIVLIVCPPHYQYHSVHTGQ